MLVCSINHMLSIVSHPLPSNLRGFQDRVAAFSHLVLPEPSIRCTFRKQVAIPVSVSFAERFGPFFYFLLLLRELRFEGL